MIRPGDRLLAGVSGGADSVCLLFVLLEYQKKVPFTLAVVHVEHGIRGEESLADARFVEELCGSLGLECFCVSRPVPQLAARDGLSLEEAARIARYGAFEEIRREKGYDRIAVAHSQNDQAETMLFSMSRGSGIRGAGGIRPVRGRIIRPLLCVSRREIEQYLRERHISWREDSSNASTEYARNYLRREILPALEKNVNSGTVSHLAALSEDLQEAWDFLEETAGEAAGRMIRAAGEELRIDLAALLREKELLRGLILREALGRAGCGLKDITREHIAAILSLAEGQSGRSAMLPGGWQVRREFGGLVISQGEAGKASPLRAVEITGPGVYETAFGVFACRVLEAGQDAPDFTGEGKDQIISQKAYTKWFDCDKINGRLFLRTACPGDFLTIHPDGGTKKLNRYLMEQKIPSGKRGTIPVLAAGSEVLWAVGYRTGERFRVSDKTKKILEIQRMGESDGGESECFNSGRQSG